MRGPGCDSRYSYNPASLQAGPSSSISIDLQQLLTRIVGPFTLQFIEHGQLRTIGDLRTPTINNAKVGHNILKHRLLEENIETPYSEEILLANDCSSAGLDSTFSESQLQQLCAPLTGSESEELDSLASDQDANIDDRLLALQAVPTAAEVNSPALSTSSSLGCEPIDAKISENSIVADLLTRWDVPRSESLISQIQEFRNLLWSLKSTHIKPLAAELINRLYPMRRKISPYKNGKPFKGWPRGIKYRDPAHVSVDERLCLLMWLHFDPKHSMQLISHAHRATSLKTDYSESNTIVEYARKIRREMWETCESPEPTAELKY